MTGCKCYCPRFLHKGRLVGLWENVMNPLFVDSCTNFVPTYVKGILQPKVKILSSTHLQIVYLFLCFVEDIERYLEELKNAKCSRAPFDFHS